MSKEYSLLLEIINVIGGYESICEEVKENLIEGGYTEELQRFREMLGEIEEEENELSESTEDISESITEEKMKILEDEKYKIFEELNNLSVTIDSIIGDKSISKSLLKKLSKNEDKYIRGMVSSNHKTPMKVLKKLSKDSEYIVTDSMYKNPKYRRNIEVIGEIIPSWKNKVIEIEKPTMVYSLDCKVRY
jgi:hypothetical protein